MKTQLVIGQRLLAARIVLGIGAVPDAAGFLVPGQSRELDPLHLVGEVYTVGDTLTLSADIKRTAWDGMQLSVAHLEEGSLTGTGLQLGAEAVTDGKTLAQPLAKSRLFPQLMIDLIKIGEETGDVPAALSNVADTYENDLNVGLTAMTNLIQPVIIVAIAFVVGFMLLGVMSAMFKITESISTR